MASVVHAGDAADMVYVVNAFVADVAAAGDMGHAADVVEVRDVGVVADVGDVLS